MQSYKPALETYNTVDADVITFESSSSGGIDLEAIGKTITEKKIAIGVIDHHTLQVESPDEVAEKIRAALKFIPPERLVISTDCGMGREGMSRRHAFYKIVSLVLGTNIVRKELGVPQAEVSGRRRALFAGGAGEINPGPAGFIRAQETRFYTGRTSWRRRKPNRRLLIPSLKPFYDAVVPLSWLIIRVAVGWNLFVHGYNKILIGPTDAFLKGYADLGFVPPALFWWSSFLIEMLGGVCIILGLVHPLLRGRGGDRDAVHFRRLLGQRLRLDEARLRIRPALGT